MSRKIKLSVLMWLLLSGCASLKGTPDKLISDDDMLTSISPIVSTESIKECNTNLTIECRNKIVYNKLLSADIEFGIYSAKVFNEDRSVAVGTTLVALGLNAASMAYGSALLTGISSAVIGAGASYDSEVLANKVLSSIQSQMNAERYIIKTRIIKGLNQSTLQYSLNAANIDLEAYYQAGTLLAGISGINTAASNNATIANDILQKTIVASYTSTISTGILNKYIFDSKGNIIPDHVKLLEKWLVKNEVGMHSSLFINSNDIDLETKRQQAIKDLEIIN